MPYGGATERRQGLDQSARSGAILGVVLIVLVVLSLLGVGLIALSAAAGVEAGRNVSSAQAFWAAEAGVEQVKAIGQKRRRPYASIVQAGSPSGYLWGSNALSGSTSKGTYVVDVLDDPTWTNATHAIKKYVIRSRGTAVNGAQQTVIVNAIIQSFASYMHASHLENNVNFGTGDIIDGPVYVNDQIHVTGSPRFLQDVSSAASSVDYNGGANSSVFEGGLTLNAVELDFTGQASGDYVTEVKNEASATGLSLTGNYKFNFRSDGTFVYTNMAGGAANTVRTGSVAGVNGAIYVSGDAWVQGVVKGNVTLAAQDAIYVSNSVTYASAASPNPWNTNFVASAVTDTLGLIASNQVQIVGTNAITLHAAVMVTSDGGGFNADRYTSVIGKPPINLFGSLSQYRRGPVGQATSPWRGYSKNYKFDVRFNSEAPPNFPYSVYVFSRWRQTSG